MKDKKNKKEYKTLLSVLAHGATDNAQKVLVENGLPEAGTYEELEYNLAKIYSNSNDKIALERHFAEIHPHSAFILKYLVPKKEENKEITEDTQAAETETTTPKVVELTSNASGCGCSSAEGMVAEQSKTDYTALALVSIVAIVGLVIITRPKI
jgi:hypothetical protein